MEEFPNIPYRQYARGVRRLDASVTLPDGRRLGVSRGERIEYQLEGVCPSDRRAALEDFWDRHYPGVPFSFVDRDLDETIEVVFDGELEIEPLVGQIVWRVPVCATATAEIAPAPPLVGSPCGGDDDDPPDLDLPSPEWTSNASIAGFDFDVYRDEGYGDYALSNCWDASAGAPVTLPPGVAYEATECEGYTGATRAGTPALAGEFRDVPTRADLRFLWDGFNWEIPATRWFWLRNRFTTPSGVARTDWVGPYERRVVGD